MARQPALRAGLFSRLPELCPRPHHRRFLVGPRANLLFRGNGGHPRVALRFSSRHAGLQAVRGQAALHHHFPDSHDGGSGRGGLQLFDDLHRLRAPQPAFGSDHRSFGREPAHPLALSPHRRAVGDHPRRRMAVDIIDVPDFSLWLRRDSRSNSPTPRAFWERAGGRYSGKSICRCSSPRS